MVNTGRNSVFECRILDVDSTLDPGVIEQVSNLATQAPRAHYLQDPARCNLVSGPNGSHKIVLTYADGKLVASSVVREVKKRVFGGLALFVDRGPIALDSDSMAVNLNDLLATYESTGLTLCISPYVFKDVANQFESSILSCGFRKRSPNDRQYTATLEFALLQDEVQNLSRLSPAFRRQIKKSERMGMSVIDGDFDDKSLYLKFRESYEAKGLSFPVYESWKDLSKVQKKNILITGMYRGNTVSAIMCATFGRGVVFCCSFADKHAVRDGLPATHALHWAAIKRAVAQGYEIYDLGGYWSDRGSADPINYFKKQTGGKVTEIMGEFEYVFSRCSARIFRFLKMVLRKK